MDLGKVFASHVSRIVAFVLTPVLAVAAAPAVQGLNDLLGTSYTSEQLSNVAIAVVVGIALAAFQWLRGRGSWEAKIAELEALYRAGAEYAAQDDGLSWQDEGQDPGAPPPA